MEESDYPPLFAAADTESLQGQQRHRRVVIGSLASMVFAAAMAVVVLTGYATVRLIAVVTSAFVLVAGIAMARYDERSRQDRLWFNGRAVAETVKSLTWRYMMHVPPFEDDERADAMFSQALDDVGRETSGMQAPGDREQITPRMRDVRALDASARRDLYARMRLANQIDWYAGRSARNALGARRWSRITLLAQMGAVAAAIVAVAGASDSWMTVMAFLATIAASATAWTQFSQHALLTKTYAVAAFELEQITALARIAKTDEDLIEVVRNGEGAISREHTMWTAKRHE